MSGLIGVSMNEPHTSELNCVSVTCHFVNHVGAKQFVRKHVVKARVNAHPANKDRSPDPDYFGVLL